MSVFLLLREMSLDWSHSRRCRVLAWTAVCRWHNLEQMLKLFWIWATAGDSGGNMWFWFRMSWKQKTSLVLCYAKSSGERSPRTLLCYFEHVLASLISANQQSPSRSAAIDMPRVTRVTQQRMLELIVRGKCDYLTWWVLPELINSSIKTLCQEILWALIAAPSNSVCGKNRY